MNNLINIFRLHCLFVFYFLLWSCLKLQDTVALSYGHSLIWWKLKIHVEQRNLSLKTPVLAWTLFFPPDTVRQTANTDLCCEPGCWRWSAATVSCELNGLLALHPCAAQPPSAAGPNARRDALTGLRSVWGFAFVSLSTKNTILTLKIDDRWCARF